MDFELKPFSLADACRQKCDALVAVVTDTTRGGTDPVSRVVDAARKSGDFEPKAGKLLQAWGVEGVAARRVVIAGSTGGPTLPGLGRTAPAASSAATDSSTDPW